MQPAELCRGEFEESRVDGNWSPGCRERASGLKRTRAQSRLTRIECARWL